MDKINFDDVLFADLHIHSRFSRACSININFENLVKWAKIKGLNLLGTGDFTHPLWMKEIKEKLIDNGKGFYFYEDFPFILTGEISLIYTQDHGRRIHLVLLVPNLEIAEKINSYLDTKGRRDYDGRPIFKIPGDEFVNELMKISSDIEIIPAHIWTPWFGVFGSMSGFDSLKECFKEQFDNIHAIETGMSCYDEETDVLTNNGWKRIDQVNFSDEICTLDFLNDKIEFQKPSKLFKYNYNGKMYRLKTKRVDLLVTPNHNLLVSHCDFRKRPNFILKEAQFLFNKSKRFIKSGKWSGQQEKYFILPDVRIKHGSKFYSGLRKKSEKKFIMEDWLKFFGFWIAEGWTSEGKNGDYGVYLANKNESLVREMKTILECFGYKVYQYLNRNLQTLRIRDFQLFSYLQKFGKSSQKFIPNEVKKLSKELLELFFNYYIKGDGNIYGRNKKGLRATTISIKLRDDLQEIALKLGMSAYYKIYRKKGTPILSLPQAKERGYLQSEDSWTIYFIRKNIHTVMPSTLKKGGNKESWENYNGGVYCLEVPNHTIYIRRNSIPVWCGNSDPEMNWRIKELEDKAIVSFSDAHSFWPFRLGREATIFKKIDSYAEIINQIRNKTFLATIETDPAYGKYHYDGHMDCNFSCSPDESSKLNGVCPICKKPLTIGVENRVEQLASYPSGHRLNNSKPFFKILPLHEIISLFLGSAIGSKGVWKIYDLLISEFGNELNILLNISKEEMLGKNVEEKLIGLILRNREGKIKVKPGYDGVYGVAEMGEKQGTLI